MSGSSVAACILVFLLNIVFGISCLKVAFLNSGLQNLNGTENCIGYRGSPSWIVFTTGDPTTTIFGLCTQKGGGEDFWCSRGPLTVPLFNRITQNMQVPKFQLYCTELKINLMYCLFRIQEYESDCLFLFGAAPLQEQWPTRRAQVIIYKSWGKQCLLK